MPRANLPQLATTIRHTQTGDIRPFIQLYGTPSDTPEYYGRMNISDGIGQSRPEGDIVEVPSDFERSQFVKIAEITRSLERGTFSFTQLADVAVTELWDDILQDNPFFTIHLLVAESTVQPQDYRNWNGKIVLSKARITELTRGENNNPQTSEDNGSWIINGSIGFWNYYVARTVNFTDVSDSTTVVRNLNDAVIRATSDKRTSEIYGVSVAVTSTSPSAVVYRKVNDASSLSFTDITALSTDGEVEACAVAGDYLIASSNAGESHIYSTLADIRAGSDNFTEITTGYVTSSGPNNVFVYNVGNIFLPADGGYIYKLTSPTSNATVVHAGTVTAQNLNAIHAFGSQLVAVGASSAIIASDDLGATWYSVTPPTAGLAINTVYAFDLNQWWIGAGNGSVYYTLDGGVNWTTVTLPGAPSAITEINFYQQEGNAIFGYITGNDGSNALLYRTTDGGNTWNNSTPDFTRFASVFNGIGSADGVSIINQNEVLVFGEDVLGYGV